MIRWNKKYSYIIKTHKTIVGQEERQVNNMNSYKIMIVDDDKKILKFLKDFLELENYTVITAENGEDVLKKINTLPDLILLDINMPLFLPYYCLMCFDNIRILFISSYHIIVYNSLLLKSIHHVNHTLPPSPD